MGSLNSAPYPTTTRWLMAFSKAAVGLGHEPYNRATRDFRNKRTVFLTPIIITSYLCILSTPMIFQNNGTHLRTDKVCFSALTLKIQALFKSGGERGDDYHEYVRQNQAFQRSSQLLKSMLASRDQQDFLNQFINFSSLLLNLPGIRLTPSSPLHERQILDRQRQLFAVAQPHGGAVAGSRSLSDRVRRLLRPPRSRRRSAGADGAGRISVDELAVGGVQLAQGGVVPADGLDACNCPPHHS